MKILIVAMAESVHTASWINQIIDQGWDIHLFSSFDNVLPHSQLTNLTIYQSLFPKTWVNAAKNKAIGINVFSLASLVLGRFLSYSFPGLYQRLIRRKIILLPEEMRLRRLCRLIKKLRPDAIHTMEFQAAGYLVLQAKKRLGPEFAFPVWIATIWGSDIYWFGRFPEHRAKIKEILQDCDYYSCECQRDVLLAQKYGLKGQVLLVGPVTAGYDLAKIGQWRQPLSKRKLILLKGYQGVFGRAQVGLEALKKCVSLLKGYEIKIFSAGEDLKTAGYLFEQATGVPISIVPSGTTHEEILKLHGRARISISLSISDGICVSFMESMVMGSLPIQSNTSCSNEWAVPGQSVLLVEPDDADGVAKAIRRALTDSQFVKQAVKINWLTAQEKLSHQFLKQRTVEFYQKIEKILAQPPSSQTSEKISSRMVKFIFGMVLSLWIIACLGVWLLVGGGMGFRRSFLYSSKITAKVEVLAQKANQQLSSNQWFRLYIWRTYK